MPKRKRSDDEEADDSGVEVEAVSRRGRDAVGGEDLAWRRANEKAKNVAPCRPAPKRQKVSAADADAKPFLDELDKLVRLHCDTRNAEGGIAVYETLIGKLKLIRMPRRLQFARWAVAKIIRHIEDQSLHDGWLLFAELSKHKFTAAYLDFLYSLRVGLHLCAHSSRGRRLVSVGQKWHNGNHWNDANELGTLLRRRPTIVQDIARHLQLFYSARFVRTAAQYAGTVENCCQLVREIIASYDLLKDRQMWQESRFTAAEAKHILNAAAFIYPQIRQNLHYDFSQVVWSNCAENIKQHGVGSFVLQWSETNPHSLHETPFPLRVPAHGRKLHGRAIEQLPSVISGRAKFCKTLEENLYNVAHLPRTVAALVVSFVAIPLLPLSGMFRITQCRSTKDPVAHATIAYIETLARIAIGVHSRPPQDVPPNPTTIACHITKPPAIPAHP